MRVRMRCYEGGIADLGDVPEPAFVKVREINQNSQLIAGANQLFTEIGQTWSSIGRRGAEERHAVPERIRSAPTGPSERSPAAYKTSSSSKFGSMASAPSR